MPRKEIGLKLFAAVCFVGVIMALGSVLSALGLVSWYQTVTLPPYAPPGAVIGAVWTVLYALLAAAITFSWHAQGSKPFWRALGPLYLLNGVMNVLWSYVFFSMHDISGAAVTAGMLAFTVLVLICANVKISKTAAILLIPYLLWTCFATVLNVHISILNPQPGTVAGTATLPMAGERDVVADSAKESEFTLVTSVTKKADTHLSLTLDRVNDSRCPATEGVYCIWAGELSPEITAVLDGKTFEIRLGTTTAREGDVGPYHLMLLDAGLESAKIRIDIP